MEYLGVDKDTKNQFEILKTYFNLKYVDENAKVIEGKRGYNFISSLPSSVELRAFLGDDPDRLWHSQIRAMIHKNEVMDIIFTKKKYAGKWTKKEEVNLMSMPFWLARRVRKW
jgi:hypothetical protein